MWRVRYASLRRSSSAGQAMLERFTNGLRTSLVIGTGGGSRGGRSPISGQEPPERQRCNDQPDDDPEDDPNRQVHPAHAQLGVASLLGGDDARAMVPSP